MEDDDREAMECSPSDNNCCPAWVLAGDVFYLSEDEEEQRLQDAGIMGHGIAAAVQFAVPVAFA